eukprot:COSAG02_NODE_1624_length_11594_cov_6.314833_10_plen_141_part_00
MLVEQSISRGKGGRAAFALGAISNWLRLFAGQTQRPDVKAIVAAGMFEECVSGIASFAAAGVEGLGDANHYAVTTALTIIKSCTQGQVTEARIRSIAPALRFCLEHDLDFWEQIGVTTGAFAAQICKSPLAQSQAVSICT